MTVVRCPPNVVAGVIAYLRARDFDARTRVPTRRIDGRAVPDPGAEMIRVTRVGGEPDNPAQDTARILIEVWAQDQPASFRLARRLWAIIAAIDDQDALPGMVAHHVAPATMPLQFPDDNARDLERHQFEIEMRVRMEEMEVP